VALYLEHFGLSEPPFRITPHTDFFFDGADRGATLEALMYAIVHDEGIVKVSGEVGSGKTMLCRVLMDRLPAQVETIYLATPSLARDEILQAIADELELKISQERMTVALRELQEELIRLYAAGRRVVILVDEAHVMPEETLEQVRLLSNLESNRHKLLQIVLFGQPELDATLAKASLRQLRDRITHSFRTRPLSPAEVTNYVSFRMRAAGYRGPEVFSPRSTALIARASGGLTRRINILADKSLLAAFTENTHAVAERHVRAAVADSEFSVLAKPRRPAVYVGAALAAGIALGVALHWLLATAPSSPTVPAPTPASTPLAAIAAAPVLPEKPPEAPPPPTHLTESQLRRLAGYSGSGQPLLASRISATRDVLERAPDERYAIELFITDNPDPARMERFLQRAREMVPLGELFVIPMAAAGQYRLRVVLGEFENREAALQAGRRLPPKYLQAFRTAPRSFGELRSQI
jgi:type II secretory pathway predicted ATPase ExeA